MQLVVDSAGAVRCVYDEAIDLAALGSLSVRRGSRVEPDATGNWTADTPGLAWSAILEARITVLPKNLSVSLMASPE